MSPKMKKRESGAFSTSGAGRVMRSEIERLSACSSCSSYLNNYSFVMLPYQTQIQLVVGAPEWKNITGLR